LTRPGHATRRLDCCRAWTVAACQHEAADSRDLEAMLDCFQPDYHSEQPLFPSRTFQGVDQVRANWSALLAAISDFRADVEP